MSGAIAYLGILIGYTVLALGLYFGLRAAKVL
ncbi:cytochrome b6-f complex subunit PetL [Dactylococcopsis salina]|uniref:Cytochrome B6-F complex subunit VI (PetL) n=1 Tax=Dactylococcopsis salina (strain PCC 8305) TaxID=13035 RepID=K9YRL6_DACS8|nr:cytochrome b6-f complex subunit PetL [Dactylococcopsis salina]AFZ49539.1 Cytochrome B6-F complex subunit VI (PetL) [Dactylococcopsis salina PCC 8305]